MKTDRELLELAAKAINKGCWHPMTHITPNSRPWNPLDFNDDAFALGVELRLLCSPFVQFEMITSDAEHLLVNTRRAIVRAAAAIGEGMAPFPTAEEIERFAGMDGKPEWDK